MDGSTQDPRGALRESTAYWSNFIARCISKRLDTDRFEEFVPLVYSQHPLAPIFIADLFLKPQPTNDVSLDPRMPPYIKVLSRLGYIDAPSILWTMYKYSSLHAQLRLSQNGDNKEENQTRCRRISSWAEEVMFYHVIKTVVEGSSFRDSRAALVLVKSICKWMDLFTSASTAFAADVLGQIQSSQVRDEMDVARAAFIPLLLRLVETPSLIKVISKPVAKAVRKELSESLSGFIHTLQPSPGFVERLEIFRSETLARLDPVDKKKQAADNAAMDELLETTVGLENFVIPDIPISTTRAGLYVYLNASLVGRPLIDDNALLSYLHNRYQGETQSSAIDLVLASFDILANTVFRNEGQKDAHLLRSFLINKVPLLLCQLCSPQFSTTSSEFCITEALNQVDTSVFPTASLMFDESRSNNPYTESVREEFCTACALHGLVQREHVERILGETSMSYEPSLEKYSKDKLVQDCLSDPEKIQGLVRELDKMDGNVGAVSQALVELMRQLCNNKETMSLKLLCGQLAQKPQSLDILLLFEKLPAILEPLCQLLDNWRYDDDQGEYQPIYEEFGAILLLVLAFAYRYSLTGADIGITSTDSCITKILNRAHMSREMDELTMQEKGYINGWIHGLFDSEAGGLGDDLMSSCPPQDFYLLVASIFQNIVVAYTYGYLNDETLKSGIEYLVDTFLLPSLVPAIRFLADYLWVEQKEQKSIIKILQLILLPSSISGEASTMLSSVKNLIAKPLEHSLRTYQKQDPKNQDIEPLLRALKDSLPLSRRTGGAEHNELESWASSSSTGLAGAVKHTVQGLVQWSMHHGINVMPTSYTHRQMIAACRIMGTGRVLRVMLEEIRHQSEAGSANIVYDVVAALICAPDVTNEPPAAGNLLDAAGNVPPTLQRRLKLREVLRSDAQDCRKLQKKDAALAEIVVRLHRRVEAQMVLPQPQAMLEASDMPLDLSGGAAGLGDAMAAAAGVQGDGMSVEGVGLDMGLGGVSSDLGLGGPSGSVGGLDSTSDGDLFGGIDTSMDMFNGWDGMDLGGN
ncbi:Mediator of RNA polymerase II transcription subunit 5 [Tolypocladium ophioglossoides CBS 100239]|uniref:Mediator of RNA polymerase II transcription subunit 5 n=1 Tax=Tolypocladium ophioglossoides (strain CBS 100239) TaxID=1163406 RepID=A0A0L0NIM4_TOLOC|nr:Mediator of RNA polymerase II transcription subunit 5 [Tolypocladium ophioglossoides CBS 100239]